MKTGKSSSATSQEGTQILSSTAAVTDTFTTESLKKLQSKDERRLLDVVDKLRRAGLNGTIELPQLVVCGDQSSGKSSVLEAITELPFPRKAGLCTRFATEIVLRRQSAPSVTIKIMPNKLRTEEEKKRLSAFSIIIKELSDLPEVIELATKEMGLGKVGASRAFSRDVLSVEIAGPDRPQLTLVDLPGLIHSATKSSTDADKDLIFDIVQEYMQNPRTIILAVVSAKNDAANQIVLNLFKKIDKNGSRTLGIITKPDCMSADDEQFWFDLHQNKEIFLERGWHMVKNRSEGEMQATFADRNAAEEIFFAKGRFQELSRDSVGIEALRIRLSNLLLRHLTQELPSLKQEMTEKLRDASKALAALGVKRNTPQEQRMLLTKISMQIHEILAAALNGHYQHSFFEAIDNTRSIDQGTNIRRFRAVLQFLNWKFAEDMRLSGHKYEILSEGTMHPQRVRAPGAENPVSTTLFGGFLEKPEKRTKEQALSWVKDMINHCRGHELPGSINPDVTSHLFWEQSQFWENISEVHIRRVRIACKDFIGDVLKYAAPGEMVKPLQELIVNAALDEALKNAKEELKKLVEDKARPPNTYNHYYSDTVQKKRHEKYQTMLANALSKARPKDDVTIGVYHTLAQGAVNTAIKQDMQSFAAEEALESEQAIYKAVLKVFTDNVANQVIERCMIAPLPDKILSPVVVSGLSDQEVAYIAAEPLENQAQRAFLEQRKNMLEQGFEIFREALGGVKRSMKPF